MEDFIGEVIEIKETGNPVIKFYNPQKEEHITRMISYTVIPFKFSVGTKVHYQGKIVDEKPSCYFELLSNE